MFAFIEPFAAGDSSHRSCLASPPCFQTFKKRLPYKTPYHTDVLYPILSLMIFNLSLYMGDRPDNKPANRDMGGSFCMCTAVGCYCHQICCKTAEEPNPTDASCVYMESKCDCQTPLKQFHQLHNQCYCFDVRYALPGSLLPAFNDSEHPAICNLLGFTFGYIAPGKGCVMVNAFGKSIGEIRKLAHDKQ